MYGLKKLKPCVFIAYIIYIYITGFAIFVISFAVYKFYGFADVGTTKEKFRAVCTKNEKPKGK